MIAALTPLPALTHQGRGLAPADMVLKGGGRVFDLVTGDLLQTDVAIRSILLISATSRILACCSVMTYDSHLLASSIDTRLRVRASNMRSLSAVSL